MREPEPIPALSQVPAAQTTWQVDGAGTGYRLALPWLLPVAVDPQAMAAACDRLLVEAEAAPTARAAWLARSLAGYMLVCLGDGQRAVDLLQSCVDAQHLLDDAGAAVRARLRLTQALQVAGRPTEAVGTAQAALALTEADARTAHLRHFALHHLGKALHHAGDPVQARTMLDAALELRHRLGDDELTASTVEALGLVKTTLLEPGDEDNSG
jgi:tetratricopeptide (TPR) repeat protein